MASSPAKHAAIRAVRELAGWAQRVRRPSIPTRTTQRLHTVLFGVLAANAVGAQSGVLTEWRKAWPCPPGSSPLVLGYQCTDAATAAFCNGVGTVCRELDEGHKFAKGHPAAQGFPAVIALAAEQDSAGVDLESALLVAYEVAARFGRATSLRSGAHPHGNWGVAGAAAGCAKLLGCDADAIAAAIDAGSGMPIAGHFDAALDGNPVRDLWVGAANAAGITATRAAVAGLARNTGTAASSLGELMGTFDPEALTDDLGRRFEIERNYFKRHSSCSFTHPVADLVLQARTQLFDVDTSADAIADAVDEIHVQTHRGGAMLDRAEWETPLAAMFSIPFVAAAALVEGEVTPRLLKNTSAQAPALAHLAKRVVLTEDERLTARLPTHRAARVTVSLRDGRHYRGEADNPIGDSDFQPFGQAGLALIFAHLLGSDRAILDRLDQVVDSLSAPEGTRHVLRGLTGEQLANTGRQP